VKSLLVGLTILSVQLQAPFVAAEASALQVDGDRLWVEVAVETTRAASTVLMRAFGPDDQGLDPVALEQRGARWTARVFLPRRSDIRLTFEHIDAEGFSFVSRPAALIELGVDVAVFGLDAATAVGAGTEPEPLESRSRWLWLALALAATAAALLLITFGRGRREEPEA
jgi:hypothetical protein